MNMFALYILILCLGVAIFTILMMFIMGRRVMGDGPAALLWYLNWVYVRVVHRLESSGCDCIPTTLSPGKLIVVCKHQSPVDPLLVQSRCRFKIRWLMAREYMSPSLKFVWKHSGVIPVDRDGQDSAGLRTALRHLREDGVIGIFPEGGIHQPRDVVHPFAEGVGAMISKTHAKVLLVTVDGTPQQDDMGKAILERSHSKVRFLELIEFSPSATPLEITSSLRERIAQATGWSLVE